MNDLTDSRGDAVEELPTLLAQYARVQRDLAALATNPVILQWRDAERAKANIEAAIKEEAHKGTESVRGSGWLVKVTPRKSVKWLADIMLEKLPWLAVSGYVTQVTTVAADAKKLDLLLKDRALSTEAREILLACRTEEALTPSVSIVPDMETILAPEAGAGGLQVVA